MFTDFSLLTFLTETVADLLDWSNFCVTWRAGDRGSLAFGEGEDFLAGEGFLAGDALRDGDVFRAGDLDLLRRLGLELRDLLLVFVFSK